MGKLYAENGKEFNLEMKKGTTAVISFEFNSKSAAGACLKRQALRYNS